MLGGVQKVLDRTFGNRVKAGGAPRGAEKSAVLSKWEQAGDLVRSGK